MSSSSIITTLMDCVNKEARRRNVSEHWLLNSTAWFEEFATKNAMYALNTRGQLDRIPFPLMVPSSAQQLLTMSDENEFVPMLDFFEEQGQPIKGMAKFLPVVGQRQGEYGNNFKFYALPHVIVLIVEEPDQDGSAKEQVAEVEKSATEEEKPQESSGEP